MRRAYWEPEMELVKLHFESLLEGGPDHQPLVPSVPQNDEEEHDAGE